MYKSFQAIEMTGLGVHEVEGGATEENLARCVNLLKYWVVYTFFTVIEIFSDVVLSWVPFYYPLKLALLVWCLKYDGAQSLYTSTFGKLLKVRERSIETRPRPSSSFLLLLLLSPCLPVLLGLTNRVFSLSNTSRRFRWRRIGSASTHQHL